MLTKYLLFVVKWTLPLSETKCALLHFQLGFGSFLGIIGSHLIENKRQMVRGFALHNAVVFQFWFWHIMRVWWPFTSKIFIFDAAAVLSCGLQLADIGHDLPCFCQSVWLTLVQLKYHGMFSGFLWNIPRNSPVKEEEDGSLGRNVPKESQWRGNRICCCLHVAAWRMGLVWHDAIHISLCRHSTGAHMWSMECASAFCMALYHRRGTGALFYRATWTLAL